MLSPELTTLLSDSDLKGRVVLLGDASIALVILLLYLLLLLSWLKFGYYAILPLALADGKQPRIPLF